MSDYAELFWPPTLGPTGWLLWRRLAGHGPGPHDVDLPEVAAQIGVRSATKLRLSLTRLERFKMARWSGDRLFVIAGTPHLLESQVARLPVSLARLHAAMLEVDRLQGRPGAVA